MSGVVHSTVETLLVATIGGPAAIDPRATAAMLTAVPMTSVTRLANGERNPAPATQQQVQENVRHQALHRHRSFQRWTSTGDSEMLISLFKYHCRTRPGRSGKDYRGFFIAS
jgi:hypothetical protein